MSIKTFNSSIWASILIPRSPRPPKIYGLQISSNKFIIIPFVTKATVKNVNFTLNHSNVGLGTNWLKQRYFQIRLMLTYYEWLIYVVTMIRVIIKLWIKSEQKVTKMSRDITALIVTITRNWIIIHKHGSIIFLTSQLQILITYILIHTYCPDDQLIVFVGFIVLVLPVSNTPSSFSY